MSSVIAAAPVIVRQAIEEHRNGRLDIAAELYCRALEVDPADSDALHLLGVLHLQRGDGGIAVPYAEKSVLVEPGMTYAYNNLGLILKAAGQPAAAAVCYRRSTLITPDFAEAHSNLGVVLKAEDQTASAIECYRRALDLDPNLGGAWNNLGNALQELGEVDAAVEAYLEAADRMPDCDTVHYNVGLLLMRLDRSEDALVHLRRAVELAPDRESARYLIAAIDGAVVATAPRNYVRDLFDAYAARFDSHLLGELRYCGHQETVKIVDAVVGSKRRFALTYDLGCGTGLVGELVRARTGRLVGIDLSARMLEQANRKQIYDVLICDDIGDTLDQQDAAPDLVLASDVFIYVGDIDGTIERLSHRMAPGGLLAFSVELAADGLDWFLRSSGRYAHGDRYVVETLTRHGFRLLARRSIAVRHEGGKPLDGAVYLAVKPTDNGMPT